MRNHPTNKITYNHIDEIWGNDLADMVDYKTSKIRGYSYIFILIDTFSKYTWDTPLKNKNSKIITEDFSNVLTASKRSPIKLKSDGEAEFYNSVFKTF